MVELFQILQGGEIGDLIGLDLQIFQLRAVGEGRDVFHIQHGENSNFQLWHVSHIGNIPEDLIVPDIKVFYLGAIAKRLGVVHRQIACHAG